MKTRTSVPAGRSLGDRNLIHHRRAERLLWDFDENGKVGAVDIGLLATKSGPAVNSRVGDSFDFEMDPGVER